MRTHIAPQLVRRLFLIFGMIAAALLTSASNSFGRQTTSNLGAASESPIFQSSMVRPMKHTDVLLFNLITGQIAKTGPRLLIRQENSVIPSHPFAQKTHEWMGHQTVFSCRINKGARLFRLFQGPECHCSPQKAEKHYPRKIV